MLSPPLQIIFLSTSTCIVQVETNNYTFKKSDSECSNCGTLMPICRFLALLVGHGIISVIFEENIQSI